MNRVDLSSVPYTPATTASSYSPRVPRIAYFFVRRPGQSTTTAATADTIAPATMSTTPHVWVSRFPLIIKACASMACSTGSFVLPWKRSNSPTSWPLSALYTSSIFFFHAHDQPRARLHRNLPPATVRQVSLGLFATSIGSHLVTNPWV